METVIATHPAYTTFWRLPGAIARHQRGLLQFLPFSLVFLVVATGLFAVPPVWAKTAPVTVLAAGDIAFCERSWSRKIKDWLSGYIGAPGAPATAALLDRLPGAVLILGDLAYWVPLAKHIGDFQRRLHHAASSSDSGGVFCASVSPSA